MSKRIFFLPNIIIEVSKAPRHPATALIYEPVYDEEGNEDSRESAVTNLSDEELKIWKKGSMFEKLKMIMNAFEDQIKLDEMHEHHDGIPRIYMGMR